MMHNDICCHETTPGYETSDGMCETHIKQELNGYRRFWAIRLADDAWVVRDTALGMDLDQRFTETGATSKAFLLEMEWRESVRKLQEETQG